VVARLGGVWDAPTESSLGATAAGRGGFEEFYRAEWPRLMRVALMLTGSRELAEDIVHDAFVRYVAERRPVTNPPAYMRSIVVNLVRDRYRHARVQGRRLGVEPGPWADPEIDETWWALQALPHRYRAALVLRFYADRRGGRGAPRLPDGHGEIPHPPRPSIAQGAPGVTTDLDETTARLVACVRAVADAIPDDAPPWDAAPRLGPVPRQPRRRLTPFAAAATVALAAALIAAVVAFHSTPTGIRLRTRMIAAAQRSVAAHTARLRVISEQPGGPALVASGLVDFDAPAYTFSYQGGSSLIAIGDQTWTTVWPPVDGTQWIPLGRGQPWPTPAEADLVRVLRPDTAPAALITALRTDNPRFADLGADQLDGLPAHHYRATQGSTTTGSTTWATDVWIANTQLLRVEVRTPTGTVSFDYTDYGIPVTIQPPPTSQT
jgi:hypothetical protein